MPAEIFYKQLAMLISEKNDKSCATTMGRIRCSISSSLIRSTVMCLRGSRSSYHHPISPSRLPLDLVSVEGRIPRWYVIRRNQQPQLTHDAHLTCNSSGHPAVLHCLSFLYQVLYSVLFVMSRNSVMANCGFRQKYSGNL